jgi:hypothetical protein
MTPPSSSDQPTPSPRDWPEDFSGENGNYQNKCVGCGQFFIGHKGRAVCKVCSEQPTPASETPNIAEEWSKEFHSMSCPFPEGCNCGATSWNNLVRENKELRKWKEEDPRMLREQIRVADSAYQQLHKENKELREKLKSTVTFEYCSKCNSPLSACGEQSVDGCPTMDCQVCQLREQVEIYGRGVSAGKQEALNYTTQEREAYGKHVAGANEYSALKQQLSARIECGETLVKALKRFKEEHLRVMLEVREVGHSEYNCTVGMICDLEDALFDWQKLNQPTK